ncbi:MAG: DNA polymerase III subunit delta [bacterium]
MFYLHGDDEFRKDEAARLLVGAHLDEATSDFNYDRLRGSEVDPETLASVLGTPPMMADWRVVLLRETEALAPSRRTRDILMETVESPPPGLALILVCTVPSGSKARFYRDLAQSARSREFRSVGADELPGWLMTRAREHHGRRMEEAAARGLAAAVGADLSVLAQELEKLDTLVPEGEPITPDRIRQAGTHIPRQDRWAWFDLVAERRFGQALEGLPVLLSHGESGVGLTIGLATHFLRLGVAVAGGRGALEKTLHGGQRWIAGKVARQAPRWTLDEVEEAVKGLLRVDRLLKSSPLPDRHFLETWLLERAAAPEEAA